VFYFTGYYVIYTYSHTFKISEGRFAIIDFTLAVVLVAAEVENIIETSFLARLHINGCFNFGAG
jgi:hypothetical protein